MQATMTAQLRRIRQVSSERVWQDRHTRSLLALICVGALLRLYLVGAKSIWLDEAFSITLSDRSVWDVLRLVVLTDNHPPLYYLALKFWLSLGSSEGWVRLLSTFFSVAALPSMYRAAAEIFEDQRAGLIAVAILAFSPFQIWYAQEARMYSMLSFLVLVSAYFLIRALRSGQSGHWFGYAAATVLALYTDNGALWYLIASAAFYLTARRHFPGREKGWLFSHAAVGLFYLPWLPFLWIQTRRVTENFWLAPPSIRTVLDTLLDFNSFAFPWAAVSLTYLVVILVLAYIVPGNGKWQRTLATWWLWAPLAISLLVSLRQPIFLSRNLIAASLGYYLLVVGLILRFRNPRATWALLAPLLLINLISIGQNAWRNEKEDWRTAAAYISEAAASQTDALVVFVPNYTELPLRYYLDKSGVELDGQGIPRDEYLLHPEAVPPASLDAAFDGRPFIWLVLRDVAAVDPEWSVKGWLDSHGYERTAEFARDEFSIIGYTRWDQVQSPRGVLRRSIYRAFLPTIASPRTERVHIVQSGETLFAIARRYGTTVQQLVQANSIGEGAKIYPGQELVIP